MEDIVLSGHRQTYQHQTGKQGICVQIGLHDVAEYLYLAKPNWKEVIGKQKELKQIPGSVADRFTCWRYYGVDADVGSNRQDAGEIWGCAIRFLGASCGRLVINSAYETPKLFC